MYKCPQHPQNLQIKKTFPALGKLPAVGKTVPKVSKREYFLDSESKSCSRCPGPGQLASVHSHGAAKNRFGFGTQYHNYSSSERIYHRRRSELVIEGLNNIFKKKTVFSKVIIVRCYKIIFPGFSKFHQKKFPALLPFPQLLITVRQLTLLLLCARVFEEPVGTQGSKVSQQKPCLFKSTIKPSARIHFILTLI